MKKSVLMFLLMMILSAVTIHAVDSTSVFLINSLERADVIRIDHDLSERGVTIDCWDSLLPKMRMISMDGEGCLIRDVYSNGAIEERHISCMGTFDAGQIFYDDAECCYIITMKHREI